VLLSRDHRKLVQSAAVHQQPTCKALDLTCWWCLLASAIQSIQQAQQCYVCMRVGGPRPALWTVSEGSWRCLDAVFTKAMATAKVKRPLSGAVVPIEAHTACQNLSVHCRVAIWEMYDRLEASQGLYWSPYRQKGDGTGTQQ
jgi:hypothetical protein